MQRGSHLCHPQSQNLVKKCRGDTSRKGPAIAQLTRVEDPNTKAQSENDTDGQFHLFCTFNENVKFSSNKWDDRIIKHISLAYVKKPTITTKNY